MPASLWRSQEIAQAFSRFPALTTVKLLFVAIDEAMYDLLVPWLHIEIVLGGTTREVTLEVEAIKT